MYSQHQTKWSKPMTDSMPKTGLLRRAWHRVAFIGGLTIWSVLGLLCTLVGAALYVLLPRRLGMIAGQRALYRIFRMFIGYMRVTGIGRFDINELESLRSSAPVVLAPNHPSLFDAVLIVSCLPNVACTMKPAVSRNPFLSGGAALAGYVANAHPKQLILNSAARLKQGSHLLAFPEGTRTVRNPINPFRGSFVLIAKRARVPIQTVFIETNSGFLGKGWSVLRQPEFPLQYRIRLGRRFDFDADSHLLVAGMQRYFECELQQDRAAAQPKVTAAVDRDASATAATDDSASDIVMN
jgi:1-acyl-sn-glycerol-3-phosphate acyltransferase